MNDADRAMVRAAALRVVRAADVELVRRRTFRYRVSRVLASPELYFGLAGFIGWLSVVLHIWDDTPKRCILTIDGLPKDYSPPSPLGLAGFFVGRPSGSRTHTTTILSRVPLPIGLPVQRSVYWSSSAGGTTSPSMTCATSPTSRPTSAAS